jgi:hypothetical protein
MPLLKQETQLAQFNKSIFTVATAAKLASSPAETSILT